MQVKKAEVGDRKKPGKFLKGSLFWSVFLFVVFLSKQIVGYPKGGIDFIISNLLSFIFAIVLAGTMLHFMKSRTLKLTIPLIWILIILLAFWK